ncbi:hypothetical protein C1645_812177 [Glomus cerebriforme]|uniref:Uncharacterized protein n=1 Tax=Glomus cerebriforme TaxID=658196 RepID=A0A397TLK8_9GLOM|nr:hypothetical protein C1645_812177 [Glomus cerebriforme]
MHPSQSDISNNSESNFTGFSNEFNNFNNNLPQRIANQAEHSSNINCIDPSCSYNNCFSGTNDNDNIFPTNTNISSDYQQSMNNVSDNNDINSTDHNHQRSISNDTLNNDHNYQQPMTNNASPPQSQEFGQNHVFPLLNSLSITINSPQTNIIIMTVANSDIQNQPQQDK